MSMLQVTLSGAFPAAMRMGPAVSNVAMYKHYNLQVVRQITLPNIDVPMWEMVREPRPLTTAIE